MTFKQRLLKFFYPLIMKLSKFGRQGAKAENLNKVKPLKDLYSITIENGKGEKINLDKFRGKKLIIVNTASNCGFTAQYDELQELYELKKDKVEIIAIPSNDFNEQEKGDDGQIDQFCRINYGLTFPVMKKSIVKKTNNQNPLFQWLSDSQLNGWNDKEPVWNFTKFVINEEGYLTHYFGSGVSPVSKDFLEAVK